MRAVRVRVPATSANMGPGFDCLGIALNLYNEFEIEEIESGLAIEGCPEAFQNEENIVVVAIHKVFERVGHEKKGLRIQINCQVPISRGLGSSSACIVGGIIGANALLGSPLSQADCLEIATEIEGHPDNVAPALYGGFVASAMKDGQITTAQLPVHEKLRFLALIPSFPLSTKEARKVLPEMVTHKAAVFNASRVPFLLAGFQAGNEEMIQLGCEDALHQPYRGPLIPHFGDIVEEAYRLGALGVFLSGAGPTIMVVCDEHSQELSGKLEDYLLTLEQVWKIQPLSLENEGAKLF